MGTTMAYAQCHHHKYDPSASPDYYQVFSIFNNTDDFNTDNPVLETPRVGRDQDFARTKTELATAQAAWDEETMRRDAAEPAWEKTIADTAAANAAAGANASPAAAVESTAAEKANQAAPPPKEITDIIAIPADKREKVATRQAAGLPPGPVERLEGRRRKAARRQAA